MKSTKKHRILLSLLLSSVLVLGAGCAKKTVELPGSGSDTPSFGGGTNIEYPAAETPEYTPGGGYSETSLSPEGTLDDTGTAAERNQIGNLSVNQNGEDMSDEYKKVHGRSSEGLSPVYFGFDRAVIRPDMTDRMMNNALILKQRPGARVVVEGNSDSRGTNEYNLALGQRRALNAKQYLINLGVKDSRIRTVSYGEERPLFPGEDEFSYAQNRRADFILE
jgi:peptidoglycan-associated lipoprotein